MREVGLELSDTGAQGHQGKLSLVVLPSSNDQHRNKGTQKFKQYLWVELGTTFHF